MARTYKVVCVGRVFPICNHQIITYIYLELFVFDFLIIIIRRHCLMELRASQRIVHFILPEKRTFPICTDESPSFVIPTLLPPFTLISFTLLKPLFLSPECKYMGVSNMSCQPARLASYIYLSLIYVSFIETRLYIWYSSFWVKTREL
jgi:hypothetical protein